MTTFNKTAVKTYAIEGMIKPLPMFVLKQTALYEATMAGFLVLWGIVDWVVTIYNKKKGVKKS